MFNFLRREDIDTDEQKIDELLKRGVDEVIDTADLRKKLLSGKQLRIKLGVDPTSPNIHLGRSASLLKLKDFQDLGHKVIFLVGDFTGVIGDTSDKDAERPMLTDSQVEENQKKYFEQAGKIIDLKKAELRKNSEWLSGLTYKEIGEHATHFSVNQFIQRDNIRRRLDEGKRVSLREVLYPLMQGYDSVALEADVELGGTDQRFNLLAGRTLQEQFNQEAQNIVMVPLIEGTDGRKMSSSWGNTINIFDDADEMFGKVMSVRDDLIIKYFVQLTRVPMSEVNRYKHQLSEGGNPKEVKVKLARALVTMYHSENAADSAEHNFKETFSGGGVPKNVPEVEVEEGSMLVDELIEAGLISSRSEFYRLVRDGAFCIVGGNKIKDPKVTMENDAIYKVGKRRFIHFKKKN